MMRMAQMKNPLLNFRRETPVDRLVQLLQESIYSGKYPPQSHQEHRRIFDAFQQGKAEEVRSLIESHTNAHMNRVLAQMESWE